MTRAAIFLRPFRPTDLEAFAPRADMASEAEATFPWLRGRRLFSGVAWTIVRWPDEVLGVGGAVELERFRTFQAWCVLGEAVRRGDWPMLLGCARAGLEHVTRELKAPRITALVREDFAGAERVLARLGFTRSALTTQWPGYRVMQRGG